MNELEKNIIYLIIDNNSLINEIYLKDEVFSTKTCSKLINFMKIYYKEYNTLNILHISNNINVKETLRKDVSNRLLDISIDDTILAIPSLFYKYQEQLLDNYKDRVIKEYIKKYESKDISIEDLIENINNIQSESMIVKSQTKRTPETMLQMIRNKDKSIEFNKFNSLNKMLKIKKKTVNVIAARPSEGKSALALNLFCDLLNNYKCIYFNMEMTEEEVYERMLGIISDIPIKNVIKPETEYQNQLVNEASVKIYNKNYEVINGSKTMSSIKNKIIREQREEHLIVFIDYVGYIVGKNGQSDKDRIGEAVRELNNITKDYNCTIFIIAQINRNGADKPTMQDLKDSGELEQTADTLILIHDQNKADTSDMKEVGLFIPKCRGGKRNITIPVLFDKTKQKFMVKENRYG